MLAGALALTLNSRTRAPPNPAAVTELRERELVFTISTLSPRAAAMPANPPPMIKARSFWGVAATTASSGGRLFGQTLAHWRQSVYSPSPAADP
jgi:hypothetical protein